MHGDGGATGHGGATAGPVPAVSAAIAAGIAVSGTSPMYGDAERLLAAALDGRRGQVLIAGKI